MGEGGFYWWIFAGVSIICRGVGEVIFYWWWVVGFSVFEGGGRRFSIGREGCRVFYFVGWWTVMKVFSY